MVTENNEDKRSDGKKDVAYDVIFHAQNFRKFANGGRESPNVETENARNGEN